MFHLMNMISIIGVVVVMWFWVYVYDLVIGISTVTEFAVVSLVSMVITIASYYFFLLQLTKR